jgi:hypothetical protein
MWDTLMDWLPDVEIGVLEVRDLLALVLTSVGAWLAWLAIRMGREQGAFTAKQMEILEGQRGLLGRLGELEEKQLAIAEKQDKLETERLDRVAKLWVTATLIETAGSHVRFALGVTNSGRKTATGVYWHLFMTQRVESASSMELLADTGAARITDGGRINYRGFIGQPIFPSRRKRLCTININIVALGLGEIEWQLVAEDGMFPGDNMRGSIVFGPGAETSEKTYAIGTFSIHG